jgi:hypothetical protein
VHIENMTIYVGAMPSATELQSAIDMAHAAAPQAPAGTIPLIGQRWPGQGGIYAGMLLSEDKLRNEHVIVATDEPTSDLDHAAGTKYAEGLDIEGHTDFQMFDRAEGHLLCANLKHLFDQTKWYWTRTQYSEGSAFVQDFNDGGQGGSDEKAELRVRAVRRFAA